MNIIGLDLSLNGTGWYWLDDSESNGGVIGSDELRGVERLDLLSTSIDLILQTSMPEVACIEDYAMGIKGGRSFSIGEWGGIVRLMLMRKNVSILLASPQSVKMFATGKGNSQKEDVKLGVYKKWDIEFKTNDECDSFVLAMLGAAKTRPDWYQSVYGKFTQTDLKALSTVHFLFQRSFVRRRTRPNLSK